MTLRRVFLWLHMMTGLAFSMYAVLLGTTGSILVFREEITEWQYPEFHSGPHREAGVSADQAFHAVRVAYPGWTPYSLTWPNANTPFFLSYMSREGQSQEAFVDPATGRVLGARNTRDGLVGWLTQAHFNLLLGSRMGKAVQGAGVVALLTMCVSGLWLWWPTGASRFASRFRVDWRAGWRKIFFQLHHVTGITGLGFIAMWAVTGGYYIWLNPYLAAVDQVFVRSVTPVIEKRPSGTALLPMAELERLARAEFPGLPLYRMAAPSAPDQPISITFLEAAPAKFHLVSTAYLDPVTGAVLQKGASADRPAGNAVLSWISVLHFGRFGNFAVRILWAALGLTLPLLAVTGCCMWWRRVMA